MVQIIALLISVWIVQMALNKGYVLKKIRALNKGLCDKTEIFKFHLLQLLHFFAWTHLGVYSITASLTTHTKIKLLSLYIYGYEKFNFMKTTYLPIF